MELAWVVVAGEGEGVAWVVVSREGEGVAWVVVSREGEGLAWVVVAVEEVTGEGVEGEGEGGVGEEVAGEEVAVAVAASNIFLYDMISYVVKPRKRYGRRGWEGLVKGCTPSTRLFFYAVKG